jgi:hypothetical protein
MHVFMFSPPHTARERSTPKGQFCINTVMLSRRRKLSIIHGVITFAVIFNSQSAVPLLLHVYANSVEKY